MLHMFASDEACLIELVVCRALQSIRTCMLHLTRMWHQVLTKRRHAEERKRLKESHQRDVHQKQKSHRSTEIPLLMRQQQAEAAKFVAQQKAEMDSISRGIMPIRTSMVKVYPQLPADDDAEGLAEYFQQHIAQSEAAQVAAQVAEEAGHLGFSYDTDLSTKLSAGQQKVFVSKIAGLLNVPEEELVIHMTPRTPGRKPSYTTMRY